MIALIVGGASFSHTDELEFGSSGHDGNAAAHDFSSMTAAFGGHNHGSDENKQPGEAAPDGMHCAAPFLPITESETTCCVFADSSRPSTYSGNALLAVALTLDPPPPRA